MKDLFPIQIIERNGRYYGLVQELSILENGEDIKQVYEKVKLKREEVIQEFEKVNIPLIKPVDKEKEGRRWFSFSLNSFIVACILLVPIASLTQPLSVILSRIANVLQLKPMEFVINLNEHLEQIPREKKMEFKRALENLTAQFDEFSKVDTAE